MAQRAEKKRIKYDSPSDKNTAIDFLDMYDDEKVQRARDMVLDRYQSSKNWLYQYKLRWIENFELYSSYDRTYEGNPDWVSRCFVPVPYQLVETIVPRAMDAFFGVAPLFVAIPKSEEEVEIAAKLQDFMEARKNQTDLEGVCEITFKETFIYGSGIQKIIYDISETYEGARAVPKDLFDFYPDPFASSIEDARYCIDREVVHIDTLMRGEEIEIYRNVDKLKKGTASINTNKISWHDRLQAIGMDAYPGPAAQDNDNMHEILEYWGEWRDPDSGEMYDCVIVIADKSVVLRFEECPHRVKDKKTDFYYALKPYVLYTDVVRPHELYGASELDAPKSQFYEINGRRNAINDAIQYALYPVMKYLNGSVPNIDTLMMYPGALVKVNEMNSIEPMDKDLGFLHGYNDMNSLIDEIRESSGIHPAITGSEGAIRKTATESMLKNTEGNVRMRLKIQHLAKSLKQMARIWYLMEHQYTERDVLIQLYDRDFAMKFDKINPAKLVFGGDFEIQPAVQFGQKGRLAQQRMEFLQTLQALPPELLSKINFEAIFRRIGDALELRPEEIFLSEEQAAANMAAMQAAQAPPPQPVAPPGVPGMPPELAALPPEAMGAPPMPQEGGQDIQALINQLTAPVQ